MKKTRNQRNRQREQNIFIVAVTDWIIFMVGVILWKAVHG